MAFRRILLSAVFLVVACLLSSLPANAAILVHDYQFNGNLNDSLGGPSLVANGGSVSATNYTFGPNEGLSLSNGFTGFAGNYSIVIDFSFLEKGDAAYAKIIDFQDLTSDTGLYQLTEGGVSLLDLYDADVPPGDVGIGITPITFDVQIQVTLTRDAGGEVAGYVDGVQQFSFTDTDGHFVFSEVNNVAHFFWDDDTTQNAEVTSGQVDRIRIYSDAAAVPEPASLAIWGLGALGCAIAGYRRRKAA
jgi:hypothetical protein